MRQHQYVNRLYRSAFILMALAIAVLTAALLRLTYNVNMLTADSSSEKQAAAQASLVSTADATGIIDPGSAPSSAGDGNVISVVEKAADSVVEIVTETRKVDSFARQFVTSGAGSGVILTEDGYIVTNYHVIEGASTITVKLRNGADHGAILVGTDEKTDLAVLKIDATGLKPASFADSSTIQVGQIAVAIGNPLGSLGGTVTEGIVSAKDREITIDDQTMTLIQTSAAVNPGNSGGGLFDSSGRLIGVVNSKSSGSGIEGLAFAIPSNVVANVTAQIVENGYVSGRPQLGVTTIEISDSFTAMRYRVNALGIYVTEASSNGLLAGDRIVSINGASISSLADINSALDKCQVGDIVSVAVVRNGEQISFSITLTEKIPQSQAA